MPGLSESCDVRCAERQRDTERQLDAMATTVKALQARVAELSRAAGRAGPEGEAATISAVAEDEREAGTSPINPEIVAALTAAATALLGKKARVRSAQLLPARAG